MLARLHAKINYAHPFREDNGRSTRAFMNGVAKHIGVKLDFKSVEGETLNSVSQRSLRHPGQLDTRPFEEMYAEIATLIEGYGRDDGGLDVDAVAVVMDDSLLQNAESHVDKEATSSGLSDVDLASIEQAADYSLTTDSQIKTTKNVVSDPDTYQASEPENTPDLES